MDIKVGRRDTSEPRVYGVVVEPIIIWTEKVGMAYHLQFGRTYVCLEIEKDNGIQKD